MSWDLVYKSSIDVGMLDIDGIGKNKSWGLSCWYIHGNARSWLNQLVPGYTWTHERAGGVLTNLVTGSVHSTFVCIYTACSCWLFSCERKFASMMLDSKLAWYDTAGVMDRKKGTAFQQKILELFSFRNIKGVLLIKSTKWDLCLKPPTWWTEASRTIMGHPTLVTTV